MKKQFNVTGTCFASQHYLADTTLKLAGVQKLIVRGEYFTINRPRQYGKTTTLQNMAKRLRETGEYHVFSLSFASVGDGMFQDEFTFSPKFFHILTGNAVQNVPELADWLAETAAKIVDIRTLDNAITELCLRTEKKIVLMIDEVDKSSNNQLFVSFLAMLRDKYLERELSRTFHSVVLAGVHDVKSLKLKLRPNEEHKYNSPWNIATDFKVDMNFRPFEIAPMLQDYCNETAVTMDVQHVAERLFHYTSGYPYLVCKLCKIIDEEILPTKETQNWTDDDLSNAVQMLMRESENVNFDSLMMNLEHNPDLYSLVAKVIFDNIEIDFQPQVPVIRLGVLYGIFTKNEKGKLAIHNRVYREHIANYMVIKLQTQSGMPYNLQPYNFRGQFVQADNSLDMVQVLMKFQAFMREHNSAKNRDFLEKDGRLLFMAFMKPIINGSGYDFKEPQISDEQRLDVVITFNQFRYLAELKIWYGDVAHQKGITQLVDYMDTLALTQGYLVIFNHNKKKTWKSEWITVEEKKVFAVWV
jgi:AAA-like domain